MTMYRRILVTGGSGVLGTALQAARKDYPDCEMIFGTRKECDLRDFSSCMEYVKHVDPDAILHLAAIRGGVALSMKYPATMLRDNVLLSINILEAARIARVRKLAMVLSSGMYPAQAPMPIREEYIHDGPAHDSNYSYAYAKRLIEPAVRAYRTEYGMSVIGLVPNGIFGENDNFDLETATMPAAVMRRFYENRHSAREIVVWGDGSPVRELTYSGDMARAFMWCLFHYDSPGILNIGTSEEHSVREIAFMVADELGIARDRIVFDASKPAGVLRKSTDNSKFLGLSKFEFTPFIVGLRNTLRWLEQNYEMVVRSSYHPAHTEDGGGA
jgi:GDP-L-fucose synthase